MTVAREDARPAVAPPLWTTPVRTLLRVLGYRVDCWRATKSPVHAAIENLAALISVYKRST